MKVVGICCLLLWGKLVLLAIIVVVVVFGIYVLWCHASLSLVDDVFIDVDIVCVVVVVGGRIIDILVVESVLVVKGGFLF